MPPSKNRDKVVVSLPDHPSEVQDVQLSVDGVSGTNEDDGGLNSDVNENSAPASQVTTDATAAGAGATGATGTSTAESTEGTATNGAGGATAASGGAAGATATGGAAGSSNGGAQSRPVSIRTDQSGLPGSQFETGKRGINRLDAANATATAGGASGDIGGGGSGGQSEGHVSQSDTVVNAVLGKDEGMLPLVSGGAGKGMRYKDALEFQKCLM